jgi:hypothetical protein
MNDERLEKQKYFYSDFIEKYDSKLVKTRVLILITAKNLYFMNSKDYIVVS